MELRLNVTCHCNAQQYQLEKEYELNILYQYPRAMPSIVFLLEVLWFCSSIKDAANSPPLRPKTIAVPYANLNSSSQSLKFAPKSFQLARITHEQCLPKLYIYFPSLRFQFSYSNFFSKHILKNNSLLAIISAQPLELS